MLSTLVCFWEQLHAINASEIFLPVYKCLGYVTFFKGSENLLVINTSSQLYPLLKTV